MRSVLLIEDKAKDFIVVKKKFEAHGWRVIPEDYQYLESHFLKKDKPGLVKKVESLILENYKDIRLAVLDLNLFAGDFEDRDGVDLILPAIRSFDSSRLDENYYNFPRQLPIIAFSKWVDIDTKRKVLSNQHHVNYFVSKKRIQGSPMNLTELRNEEELILVAESLSKIFSDMLIEKNDMRLQISSEFRHISNILEIHQDAITAKIDNLNYIIEGEFEQIKRHLDLLLTSSLQSLGTDQINSFMENYQEELVGVLGEAKAAQIETNFFSTPSWKDEFTSCVQNGSFADLSDLFVKAADELGVIDVIPGGKIIGLGITALLRILSR